MYFRLPKNGDGEFVRPVLKWLGKGLQGDGVIVQDAKKLKTAVSCEPESLCRRQRERG